MKRNVKLKKIEKENRFDGAKATLLGAVAIEDSDDSDMKKEKEKISIVYVQSQCRKDPERRANISYFYQ